MATVNTQKITTGNKTEISFSSTAHSGYTSITFTNTDVSAVNISLWITSQVGTDITDTFMNVNQTSFFILPLTQQITVDGAFTDATCDYNNDPTITHDDDSGAIKVGMPVSGTGIPTGATVASVTSDTEFELSVATTGGSVTNGTLTFLGATDDVFLNEQVWKSDGKLFGTCTTVAGKTAITFSGGLVNAIANNDSLYTGTRYYLLKNTAIPAATALKLNHEDFDFNLSAHKLYIKSSDDSGLIDIIMR